MYVQEHLELFLFLRILLVECLKHERSDQLYFSKSKVCILVVICKEKAIHIFSLSVTPVIASNYSVRVHNRNYQELEYVS